MMFTFWKNSINTLFLAGCRYELTVESEPNDNKCQFHRSTPLISTPLKIPDYAQPSKQD